MYCRHCGASGADGKFCRFCGTPVIAPTQTNVESKGNNPQAQSSQVAYPQTSNPQVQNPQGNYSQTFNVNPNYMPPAHAQQTMVRRKKSRAPVIIAVAAAALVVIAAVGLLFGNVFNSGALMRLSSPEKYYQSVEKKSLATLTAHTSNIAKWTGRGGANTTLSLTLTDDGKDFMQGMDVSWLNSMSLDVGSASNETESYAEGTLCINDTKIIDFATLTESIGGETFLKLPDFSQQYIQMRENSRYMNLFGAATPDMDAFSTVIDRYGDIVIQNIHRVEKKKETVTVGSTTSTYDALVVTIDSETSANIARAIADTAHGDRDLEKLIRSSAESEGEDADTAYAEFLADLDEAKSRDAAEANTILATMTVYVDSNGEVCGRRYVSADTPDSVSYYLTAWDGKNFETEANFVTDDGVRSITGSGSRKGDKISGDYTLRAGDVLIATVRVDDFDKKAAKGGELYGSFTITPGKDYIDETGKNPLTASLRYRIDVASASGKMDATVSLFSDVANLGTIQISGNTKKNIKIPSVSDSEKVDSETWLSSIDQEKARETLTNALTSAGVPQEYLN